jgi:AcrR family transcriptional regulator
MGRPPRGKTLLSEERLLKTAIAIVDELGVDALTMRNLAERLSVTAMSLYRYCDSHETLLDAVQRTILVQFAPEPVKSEQGYREVLTELAKSLRRAFKAHPNAVTLFATRPIRGTRVFEQLNTVLERLARAGFEPSIAHYLVDAITAFTVGLSLEEFASRPRQSTGSQPQIYRPNAHCPVSSGSPAEPVITPGIAPDYETEFIVGLLAMIDGFGNRYAKRAR